MFLDFWFLPYSSTHSSFWQVLVLGHGHGCVIHRHQRAQGPSVWGMRRKLSHVITPVRALRDRICDGIHHSMKFITYANSLFDACPMSIHADFDNCSAKKKKKKKVNDPEGAKYFFSVKGGIFFYGTIVLWSQNSHIDIILSKRIVSLLKGKIYLPLAGRIKLSFLSTVFLLSGGKFMYSIWYQIICRLTLLLAD